jgi:predicted O-linked N-acetylglucosamine transferase (SPINDLY family)
MDVLIDLSGLTTGNMLAAFAMRPAPVQMTYLGYPNTTGVAAVDYRIVDSITDPPGAEAHAVERLLRIDPCFLCYGGMEAARVAEGPPSQAPGSGGAVTFGSFNALQKVTDTTMRLWAEILRAVPGGRARLAVKYMSTGDEQTRARLRQRLEAAGVPADRIVLMAPLPEYRDHLEAYGEIDVALDTFPYNGTTTTCEALWMGVPVVTMAGRVHAARVGASLLSAAGLPDLVARDADGYVAAAVRLAQDAGRLAALRSGLREQMKRSPLCNRAGFGERFGEAVRGAWRAWCGAG